MNPYTSAALQYSDIGYPDQMYQSPNQNTSLQDQFHNQQLQEMQQMGSQQPNWNPTQGSNPMALALALRSMNQEKSGLTPKQTWDMTYGNQASPYTGGATYGVNAAQSYDYWK